MNTNVLTGYRFFAAFIVIIFHYGESTGLAALTRGVLAAGPQMVTFFFVLSGFVMMVSYLRRANFSSYDYLVARLARIVPVYLLALGLTTALLWSTGDRADILKSLALDLFFLQSWVPPYSLSLNGPAWSLSVEAFFYVSFPLIIVFLRLARPRVTSVVVAATGVYLLTQLVLTNLHNSPINQGFLSIGHELVHYFPLSHFCSFFLGIAGAYLAMETGLHGRIKHELFWTVGTLAGIIIIALFLANEVSIAGFQIPTQSSFLAPMFLLLILFSVSEKNLAAPVLSFKPLVVLGEASYSLYILQQPVNQLFKRCVLPWLSVTPNTQFYSYAVALVVLSVVVFYLFEMPAKRAIIHRLRRSRVESSA